MNCREDRETALAKVVRDFKSASHANADRAQLQTAASLICDGVSRDKSPKNPGDCGYVSAVRSVLLCHCCHRLKLFRYGNGSFPKFWSNGTGQQPQRLFERGGVLCRRHVVKIGGGIADGLRNFRSKLKNVTSVESYDRRIRSATNIQGRKMQRRAEFLLTRALRQAGWK